MALETVACGSGYSEASRGEEVRTSTAQKLAEEFEPFVRKVAVHLMRSFNLPPTHLDEFISAGYVGLVEAADRFDPQNASQASFQSYAYPRIRGAIIDGIREACELQGRHYRVARALRAAGDVDIPTEEHVASPDLAQALDTLARGVLAFRLSMADADAEATMEQYTGGTEAAYEHQDLVKKIVHLTETLPPNERYIIEEYYFRGRPFTDIAASMDNAHKGWVSKLHARAIERLKNKLLDAKSDEEREMEGLPPKPPPPAPSRRRRRVSRKGASQRRRSER